MSSHTSSKLQKTDYIMGKSDIVRGRSADRVDPADFIEHFLMQLKCWLHHFGSETKTLVHAVETPLLTCTKEGQGCFICKVMVLVFGGCKRHCVNWLSSKRSHHQWRVLGQLAEAVTKGHQDQMARKTDKKGVDLSGQCSITCWFQWLLCLTDSELVDHHPYSSKFAPSHYYLFPNINKPLDSEPVTQW